MTTLYDFYYSDRMRSVSTTTGLYELTLSAGSGPWAPITYDLIVNKKIYYCIVHENGLEWEVGRGAMDEGDVMYRNEVFSSSNSNELVDFSAGNKEVFVTLPAFVVQNIQGLGERAGIPSHGMVRKVNTTSDTHGLVEDLETNAVREFIICAYSSTGGSKSKVLKATLIQHPGSSAVFDVEVVSESETLPWTVSYSDPNIHLVGESSVNIWWYVYERVLGRFE